MSDMWDPGTCFQYDEQRTDTGRYKVWSTDSIGLAFQLTGAILSSEQGWGTAGRTIWCGPAKATTGRTKNSINLEAFP